MSARSSLRDRWLAVLDATPSNVLDCCPRYTLSVIARDMDAKGYVTVNRAELADRLNRDERTITRHLRAARDADMLAHVQRGQRGHFAVYRAVIPDSQRDNSRPAERPANGEHATIGRPAETALSGTTGVPYDKEVLSDASSATVDAPSATGAMRDEAQAPPVPTSSKLRRVAPDGDARQDQPGMRGQGAGVPPGVDLEVSGRSDHAGDDPDTRSAEERRWCRGCGGLLAVETGVVVDGRCVRCQKRRRLRVVAS